MASWRQTTGKQYQCYLLKWVSFCQENQIKIENADINDGLKFLTYLYYQGVGYSAINTARSALSAVITLGSHRTFGEHPLVTRFLKGVFELKPSLPRYSVMWDVGIVLKHLQAMAPMDISYVDKEVINHIISTFNCTTMSNFEKSRSRFYAGN
jgi:hypothetical protein